MFARRGDDDDGKGFKMRPRACAKPCSPALVPRVQMRECVNGTTLRELQSRRVGRLAVVVDVCIPERCVRTMWAACLMCVVVCGCVRFCVWVSA